MNLSDCKELSLKNVKISGDVIGKFGTFEIEQTFVNNTKKVLEVGYIFPIVETATVKGDVVLSIGETSYTINIDTLKNGAYSLVTGDELSYTPGVGFTFTIKNDKTLEKELHIAYTVDKK